MSTEVSQPVDSQPHGPPEAQPPSRAVRVLTSWKLWTVALVLAVLAIGMSLTMPIVHRWRAMKYFDCNSDLALYGLEQEDADLTERFGDWGTAFRKLHTIDYERATDESMRHIGRFPEVSWLDIASDEQHPITERGASAIAGFENLYGLGLTGEGFTDHVLSELVSQQSSLEDLYLDGTGAGEATFQAIATSPRIEFLTTLGPELDDDDYSRLTPQPGLLSFKGSGVGDRGIEWLLQSPQITDVMLFHSHLTDTGLRRLCEVGQFRFLWIDGATITGAGLQSLSEMTQLFSLALVDCPDLTADDIADMPDLTNLGWLTISADLLTPASVARLQKQRVNELTIYGNVDDPELLEVIQSEWQFLEIAPALDGLEYGHWVQWSPD